MLNFPAIQPLAAVLTKCLGDTSLRSVPQPEGFFIRPRPDQRYGRCRSGNSCTYGEAAGKPRTWGKSRYREFPASSGSCAAYRAGPWILFPLGPPWVTPPSAVPVRHVAYSLRFSEPVFPGCESRLSIQQLRKGRQSWIDFRSAPAGPQVQIGPAFGAQPLAVV